jgi:hypothetical protein
MTWDFTAQVLALLKSHDPTAPLGDLRVKRVYVSGCRTEHVVLAPCTPNVETKPHPIIRHKP